MNFLNPMMLGGFAVVSVPILIHLLNRQRFKIVDWAAQEFLRRAVKKHQRRVKIQELILLLLRCLALACVVAMLLRPIPSHAVLGQQSRMRIMVIDNSSSMQASSSGLTSFQRALASARTLVKASDTQGGDVLSVHTINESLTNVLVPTGDKFKALEIIDSLKPTDFKSWFDNFQEQIESYLISAREEFPIVEVFVVSDFQENSLAAAQFPIGDIHENLYWHFHDVGPSANDRDNLAITQLNMLSHTAVKDRRSDVEIEVQSFSQTSKTFSLKIYDGPQLIEEKTGLEISPREKMKIPFKVYFMDSGPRFLKAEISEDTLISDNDRQVAVQVSDTIPVTMLDGDPGHASYRDETYLYRRLLSVPKIFNTTILKKGEDDYGSVDLTQNRLLVLANISGLDQILAERIRKYVEDGGSLLVTGGVYVEDTSSLSAISELLPVSFKGVQEPSEPWTIQHTLEKKHPVLKMSVLYNDFENSMVNRMHEVEPLANAQVLLRAGNRYPLLTLGKVGKGNVAFWSSSLDFDWCTLSELDYIGIFGMLTQYLVQSEPTQEILPGQGLELDFSTSDVGGVPIIRGERFDQRSLDSVDEGGLTRVSVPPGLLSMHGLYEINGRSKNRLSYVAVNIDNTESDLAALPDDRLKPPGVKQVSISRNTNQFEQRIGEQEPGQDIWKTLLVLALCFLALESFLGWKWGNPT